MNEDSAVSPGESQTDEPPASGAIREVANGIFTHDTPASLSPSLWKDREEPAFEIKFQVDPAKARDVAAWAAEHLNLDPHADPALGNTYLVNGLYFDTPALDVFHRMPGFKRRKFRLRRYGAGEEIFLEQKRKSAGRVAKRRIQVAEADLQRLREMPLDVDWIGHWFHRRLSARKLQPTCSIGYQREAYFSQNGEGPLRLTLDRNIRCKDAEHYTVEPSADGVAIASDQVLLELKFRKHLPALFRAMMQDFALTPGPLSKYRLAIEALGKANGNGRPVDA
jgi:hypothetical protein